MICRHSRPYQQPSSPHPGADRRFSELQCPLSQCRASMQVTRTVVQLAQSLLEGWQIQAALFPRVERRP